MMGKLRYKSYESGDMRYKVRDEIEGKKMDPSDETAYTDPLMDVITSLA